MAVLSRSDTLSGDKTPEWDLVMASRALRSFAVPPGEAGWQTTQMRFHGSTSTGIPTHTSFDRYSASQFASRKQPWDSVRPTSSGTGVP